MPHIHIDHSPGLGDQLDIPTLCTKLRDEAVATVTNGVVDES